MRYVRFIAAYADGDLLNQNTVEELRRQEASANAIRDGAGSQAGGVTQFGDGTRIAVRKLSHRTAWDVPAICINRFGSGGPDSNYPVNLRGPFQRLFIRADCTVSAVTVTIGRAPRYGGTAVGGGAPDPTPPDQDVYQHLNVRVYNGDRWLASLFRRNLRIGGTNQGRLYVSQGGDIADLPYNTSPPLPGQRPFAAVTPDSAVGLAVERLAAGLTLEPRIEAADEITKATGAANAGWIEYGRLLTLAFHLKLEHVA